MATLDNSKPVPEPKAPTQPRPTAQPTAQFDAVSTDELIPSIGADELLPQRFDTVEEAKEWAEKELLKAIPTAIDTLLDIMNRGSERQRVDVATQVLSRVLGPPRTGDQANSGPLDKMLTLLQTPAAKN